MEKKNGTLDDNTLIKLGLKKPKGQDDPFTAAGVLKSSYK
jgi:hypothetical protein